MNENIKHKTNKAITQSPYQNPVKNQANKRLKGSAAKTASRSRWKTRYRIAEANIASIRKGHAQFLERYRVTLIELVDTFAVDVIVKDVALLRVIARFADLVS